MKIRRLRKRYFEGLSASSDLAFLLIIYFIVIAGFNINMGFLIELPARDSSRLVLREDLIRFEIDEKGNILHEGEITGIPHARALIQAARRNNPDIALMLIIDGEAHWQNVVSFVELAQDMEIESFSFSMKKDEQ